MRCELQTLGVKCELRQDWPEVSDVSMMLNSPWTEGCERSDGYAWALVLVGESVTKTCHWQSGTQAGHTVAIVRLIPMTVTSLQTRGDSNVSSNTCLRVED
jgi:hypothetical protein